MTIREIETYSVDYLRGIAGKKWSIFPDCIGAFIAEMDFGTAPVVKEALHDLVDQGFFGYLKPSLVDDLKEACATWYRTEYGWNVPAERVHAIPDVLRALEITVKYYSSPGSKLIVPTPAYMPFLELPAWLGREYIEVPMRLSNGRWEYDEDAIDAAFAAGGEVFVLCNPYNPLGRVFERDELERIAAIVDRHGGRVFSDEIHAPITYTGHRHIPYASVSDVAASHTITAISGSKAWNIPGLKCAQMVLSNDEDAAIWETLPPMAGEGASLPGVVASTAAYRGGKPWLLEVLDYLEGNRDLLADVLAEHLPQVGFIKPQGTYLAWLDFSQVPITEEIDIFFREHAKVALVNGRACGLAGENWARFNFGMSRETMRQAIEQMGAAVNAAR